MHTIEHRDLYMYESEVKVTGQITGKYFGGKLDCIEL